MKNIESPFKSNYIQVDGYAMHYLDEGAGENIVIVHGIPEWSMIYAELIQELSPNYRCIVPDHLGFGLSDKPKTIELTPQAHAKRLLKCIEQLGLRDVNLVVHDYGGPIGIGALTENPSLFKSLTLSNTWLWNLQHTPSAKILKMMSGALGKWLYLNYGFSVKFMAKKGFVDQHTFNRAKPIFWQAHQTKQDRYANYQLMLEMLKSGNYFDTSLEKLKKLDIPIEIIWGMKDKFFTDEYLENWKRLLPAATINAIEEVGHFPQYEAPQKMAAYIRRFVG